MKAFRIKCRICGREDFSFVQDINYVCLKCVVRYDFGRMDKRR